jgi:hypothetical protein
MVFKINLTNRFVSGLISVLESLKSKNQNCSSILEEAKSLLSETRRKNEEMRQKYGSQWPLSVHEGQNLLYYCFYSTLN